MKKLYLFKNGLLLAVSLLLTLGAFAQDPDSDKAPVASNSETASRPKDEKPDLFRRLGLTPDQIRQIRTLNQERKPAMQQAQQRLRLANRALDEAIYADQSDDGVVATCLQEVQSAQAELAKIRYSNEFAIRKLLTPTQLTQFRDLRQKFVQSQKLKTKLKTPLDRGRRELLPKNSGIRPLQNGQQKTMPTGNPSRPKPLQ